MKRFVEGIKATGGSAPSITISTDMVDADGDTIDQAGLTFRTLLPVLFAHDNRDLPVGVTTNVNRERSRTRASWRWLENDERAARVRNAFEQGALASSIGFIVKKATPKKTGDGYVIEAAEVVEFSLCAVPSNPGCVRTLKSLGLWNGTNEEAYLEIDDEKIYDISPADVERQVGTVVRNFAESAAFKRLLQESIQAAIRRHTGRLP